MENIGTGFCGNLEDMKLSVHEYLFGILFHSDSMQITASFISIFA